MIDRSIYPPEDAALFKKRAGEKYRPSNGTEGEIFYDAWCADCARDAAYRADPALGDSCPILVRASASAIEAESYPAEWTYSSAGQPCCTAFTTEGLPERCPDTADLFGAGQ
jgi:hypothetical protein